MLEGKAFNSNPFDYVRGNADSKIALSKEKIRPDLLRLMCQDVRDMPNAGDLLSDCVITDPPYAGNVHYGELADFFYVWLRLLLRERYPQFEPELCPKVTEIEVNPAVRKTSEDFRIGLTRAFEACSRRLRKDGLLVFTFHHRENEAWEDVLSAVCDAGFELVDAYPVHAEKETSLVLQNSSAISYDLIHVCRKRNAASIREQRAWATIKTEIRRAARKEIERIERDVYGNSKSLSPADRLIILIGKCLQLYSRHYQAVVNHEGKVVPLKEALEDIRMLVDQLVSKERPLPSELENIDRPSYVYLTALSEKKEVKSDEVHKATRGIIDVEELLEAGLMIRGRMGRGRTYEVKTPLERFPTLLDKFKEVPLPQPGLFGTLSNNALETNHVLFIDRLHFLMGLAEGGENLRPWIESWRGEIPQIRAAIEYLMKLRDFAPALKKILSMIDVGPLRLE